VLAPDRHPCSSARRTNVPNAAYHAPRLSFACFLAACLHQASSSAFTAVHRVVCWAHN
jgi:hypothetical protein